jgi:hypothetical protein
VPLDEQRQGVAPEFAEQIGSQFRSREHREPDDDERRFEGDDGTRVVARFELEHFVDGAELSGFDAFVQTFDDGVALFALQQGLAPLVG